MVNYNAPDSLTFASPEGTPQVTINRDASIDLDSSNAFEGPEKLLEVWFAPGPDALPQGITKSGLKIVSADTWKDMLDLVNCKILSIITSDHVDAYLLSESSMFVFPHKIILKTCGTTTLLLGLRRMLRIAAVHAGFPSPYNDSLQDVKKSAMPYRVFYSRKNFLFPEKQQGPHRSWNQEVTYLDDMFMGGSAYMVGKMNGDHWYLYLTTPNTTLTPPRTPDSVHHEPKTKILTMPAIQKHPHSGGALKADDETLEILMTDLDTENAKQFYLEHATVAAEKRYGQKTQEARKRAAHSLGVLEGCVSDTCSTTTTSTDDTFDVFSNTSSDNTGMCTPDDDMSFPETLTTEGHALGEVVSETCGLAEVYPTTQYPDARIDAYLFTPCGFSANGVIPAAGQHGPAAHYFTVHVTPEPQCSYASFETNVPGGTGGRETVSIIEDIVSIFKPGRFSVTLFEAKACAQAMESPVLNGGQPAPSGTTESAKTRSAKMEKVAGYRRIERIVHDFDGYDLVFRFYERDGWAGGAAPRVGEPLQ